MPVTWLFLVGLGVVAAAVVFVLLAWGYCCFVLAGEADRDEEDRMSEEWFRRDWMAEKPSLQHQRVARQVRPKDAA